MSARAGSPLQRPISTKSTAANATTWQTRGFEVTAIAGLNLERDSDMIRVRPDYIAEFAAGLDTPDADALFISCGALRSLDIVDALERRLGKPVSLFEPGADVGHAAAGRYR